MKRTVAELQRKAEDRDRSHFGPEGEEDVARNLRDAFPGDKIEAHGRAGDIVQVVIDHGREVGKVVFEVKNTKAFQRAFVRQTALAMESHSTSYGILVTRVLPARATGLCVIAGVIVATPVVVAHVAAVVRDGIVKIGRMRATETDKASMAGALVAYLRSDEFTAAIKRVHVTVGELRESLSRERSLHDGWWKTRETAYGAILREAVGVDAKVDELLREQPTGPEKGGSQ